MPDLMSTAGPVLEEKAVQEFKGSQRGEVLDPDHPEYEAAQTRPYLPRHIHEHVILAASVCFSGPLDEGEKVLQPLRALGSPVVDLIRPMPYTALQTQSDAFVQPGRPSYEKSVYLKGLSDDAIEVLVEQAAAMTSPLSHLHFVLMGGAIGRIADHETAVSHRQAAFDCYILPIWAKGQAADRHIEWARETWSAVQPFSTGGGYLNRHQSEGEDEVRAVYGAAKYERLVALKNKYDPTNFFRLNHNIKPTV